MAKNILFKKSLIFFMIFLVLNTTILPTINSKSTDLKYENKNYNSNNDWLDAQYIYNISENLSNIIFTEYNESAGEIPKGRAFGTKGEHKAAEIIQENMTKIGLWTWREQISNIPGYKKNSKLTEKIEILDYNFILNSKISGISEKVDCFVNPSWFNPNNNPDDLNKTFNFENLKIILSPKYPLLINKTLQQEEKFIFIKNPNEVERNYLIRKLFSVMGMGGVEFFIRVKNEDINIKFWQENYPNCCGFIDYDNHNDTYDMKSRRYNLPIIYINGSIGNKLLNNLDEYTVDFFLKQRYNDSVISYNIIGQLNGTCNDKTVIVCCLYDSWWGQGTTDAAIGMAMVLSIAKYFVEHNIEPYYKVKFIGFCGEEYGMRGSTYYENTHKKEKIRYVIDFNQLGFKQEEPKPTLEIAVNKIKFLIDIWNLINETNYKEKTEYKYDIKPRYMPIGHISDDRTFATKRLLCKTVCLLKNDWDLHHRCGMNYSKGDVFENIDWNDVSATAEIALNITKFVTLKNFK